MSETTPQKERFYNYFANVIWLDKTKDPDTEVLNYLKRGLSLIQNIIKLQYSDFVPSTIKEQRLNEIFCLCFMSPILREYSETLNNINFELEVKIKNEIFCLCFTPSILRKYSKSNYKEIRITKKDLIEYYNKIINMTVEEFLNEIEKTLKYIDNFNTSKERYVREFFFSLILLKYNYHIFFYKIPDIIISKIVVDIYDFFEYYENIKNLEKYVNNLINFQFKYYYPYLFKIKMFKECLIFYILYYLLLKAIKDHEKKEEEYLSKFSLLELLCEKEEEYKRSVNIYLDYARIYYLIFCKYLKSKTFENYINKVLEPTIKNLIEKLNNQNDVLVPDFSNINVDERDLLRVMMSIASKNEEFKEFAETITGDILYDEKFKEECEEILNGKKKFKDEIVIEIPLVPLNNKEKEIVKL